MSNFRLLAILLLITLASQSCRKVPSISKADATPAGTVGIAKAIDFTYLSSRGKIQFEGEGQKLSSAINLRMKKDSAIWISVVPAFGIEAVRALLTPDSVKVINRLERSYISTDYRLLERKFNIKADFHTLQALLLGNQPYPVSANMKVIQSEPELHTQQLQGSLTINSFIELTNLKLKKIQLSDSAARNSLAVTYGDFGGLDAFVFPYSAIFMAQQYKTVPPKSAVVTINHQKVSVSEASLSFPFDIPSGYTRLR
ncbi:DUF4292 domain-containing protein [bacterium]|nr:MAG: DUF4292 domain-containing protein [bacterium]